MYLYNSRNGTIVNLDHVRDIFVGSTNGLCICFPNDKIGKLIEYRSPDEAKEAVSMIADAIATGKRDIIKVSSQEDVSNRLKSRPLQTGHITGKKTKGHGGS